jgi:hypothetical protein
MKTIMVKLLKSKIKQVLAIWQRLRASVSFLLSYSQLPSEDRLIIDDIVNEKQCYQYFQSLRYLTYQINLQASDKSVNSLVNPIWRLWYQGESEQPDIVRACGQSLKNYGYSDRVILLDQNNIENYVQMPGFIYDKKKQGIISNVNFSDILRCFLLAEYGGIWLDSTVYLTDYIPEFIYQYPLFTFSVTPSELCGRGSLLASSWFLFSRENNELMKTLKILMTEFWKYQKTSHHHYYFHLLFRLSIEKNPLAAKEWAQVPFVSNVPPHILQRELFNVFDSDKLELIKQMTSIHKLTYYGKNFPENPSNTFYNFLVQST